LVSQVSSSLLFGPHRRNLSKSGDTKKASDLAAVKAVSKGIIAAENSSDIRGVSVSLPPSGPVVQGKATILARYKTSFDQLKLEYSEQSVETQIGGDWAFERGFVRGTATPKDGSAPKTAFDKYLMILHRGNDHRWRIARLMLNPAKASRPAN
jgi:ketosteroid isomerase-like protein